MSRFFLATCPNGFLEHAEKCYKVSTDKLSWHDARLECLGLDGNYDLVVIDNLELFEFLKSYTNHWIGLYSRVGKRDFKWIDNTKLDFGKVEKKKPWGASEPSVRLHCSSLISYLKFELKYFTLF